MATLLSSSHVCTPSEIRVAGSVVPDLHIERVDPFPPDSGRASGTVVRSARYIPRITPHVNLGAVVRRAAVEQLVLPPARSPIESHEVARFRAAPGNVTPPAAATPCPPRRVRTAATCRGRRRRAGRHRRVEGEHGDDHEDPRHQQPRIEEQGGEVLGVGQHGAPAHRPAAECGRPGSSGRSRRGSSRVRTRVSDTIR